MNLSDKAHLRESARRGECTPEYAEQLIREAEQATHDSIGNFKQCATPGRENAPRTVTTNGTGRT